MRILFVAMPNSVHTVRWVSQLVSHGYDLHFFPSITTRPHKDLKNVKFHLSGIGWRGLALAHAILRRCAKNRRIHLKSVPTIFDLSFWLAQTIRVVKPDIVHSLEFQQAGYLTLAARKRLGNRFPTWIATNWGSDIYLFGRLSNHVEKIRSILGLCDYYSCECRRDVKLANELGLRGEVLDILPNTGGFDLSNIQKLRQSGPISSRRLILLKGYQGWSGRAFVGLRAIELCADRLRDYRIAVYSANNDVEIAAELVSKSTGIQIEIIPQCSHDEMLQIFGRARIYIGLSISDAIPTSLLEAILMGAFPIQSCTSCANEWIENGKTGLIVPPEDPGEVAKAIRIAISDDKLVNNAAEKNARVAAERLDHSVVQPKVIAMYEKVLRQGRL